MSDVQTVSDRGPGGGATGSTTAPGLTAVGSDVERVLGLVGDAVQQRVPTIAECGPTASPFEAAGARVRWMRAATHIYRRREPTKHALYRVLQQHLETFLARVEAHGGGLPSFVVRELRAFLDCGLLCRGFARVHCSACGKDELVASSCKRRGICPSCCARRSADLAALLVDHVLPDVPIRQWVLSLPFDLRYLLGYDAELCRAVRATFIRTVLS